MIIQQVSVDDAKDLLTIYAPYVEKTAVSFEVEVPSLDEFRERIVNISSRYPYIKAVDNGEIIGYAYANSFKTRKAYDWAVETTIYIKEDCRRQGTGRLLYEELESRLRNMGILNMNACISSPAADSKYLTDDSFYFHKKMGFDLVGRFHQCGYKFDEWFDMIWMEKMIGEHTINQAKVRFGQ